MIIWLSSHSCLDVLLSCVFCIAVESFFTDVLVGNFGVLMYWISRFLGEHIDGWAFPYCI